MPSAFYNSAEYRKKQSEITTRNWQDGKFKSLVKPLEQRFCKNPSCNSLLKVKLGDPKIYCSHSCATQINNSKRTPRMDKDQLLDMYSSGLSMQDMARQLKISIHKVAYWMDKHKIIRRSISDAVYLKHNPKGDPFSFKHPKSMKEAKLLGLGLGLYWGEGNKLNKTSIRLGNTDPDLMNVFILCMVNIFGVKKEDLRFGLQIFTDINIQTAMDYWMEKLDIKKEQFYKPIITKSNSLGTYRKKGVYGVIMLNYHNRKLRDLLVGMLPTWLSGRARSW